MYWTSDSKRKEYRENVWNWKSMVLSLAISYCFQQKILYEISSQITPIHSRIEHTFNGCSTLAFPRLSHSELLCCGSLPSDIFIFNWSVITLVCIAVRLEKTPERGGCTSLGSHILSASLSLQGSWGPHSACWPWWLEDPSHPLFCLFCNKMGCFSLLLQKFTQDPPLRIVAFPCIDVWLVVHIHLLFYALDFKENERGPIMLIGSCSVKRNQGLPH